MNYQDPEVPLHEKVRYVESDPDLIDEILADYTYIQTEEVGNLLFDLALSPNLEGSKRYQILETLVEVCEDSQDELERVIGSFIPSSSTIEFQLVRWLLRFDSSMKYIPRLEKYLRNEALSETSRFSQLKSLKIPDVVSHGAKCLFGTNVTDRMKILLTQVISPEDNFEYLQEIFKIACDSKNEYMLRADAADAVYHLSKDGDLSKKAFDLLKELGHSNVIAENDQNVHFVDISAAMKSLLQYEPTVKIERIAEILREKNNPKINSSIGRILLDSANYSEQKLTASDILERLWTAIQKSPHSEALNQRMIEELEEMADTCSSGHAFRLLNVMSGFGEGSIKITFKQQVVSNFMGRFNAKIMALPEGPEKDEIISGMALTKKYISTKTTREEEKDSYVLTVQSDQFQRFLTRTMPGLIAELQGEFVGEFMEEDDFFDAVSEAVKSLQGN